MSSDNKFVIMLEITSGMSERLLFNMDSLKDDNIVAMMDEINNVIWLWMGKNTGLVQRRGSMRAARSLKAYGHEIGNYIVGRKLSDVLDVRGDSIESDPEQKGRFEKILSILNAEHSLKFDGVLAEYVGVGSGKSNIKYGLTTEQRSELVKAALAAPTAGDDTRKIEQIVGDFRPPPPPESSTAKVIPKYQKNASSAPIPTPPKPAQPTPPTPAAPTKTVTIQQRTDIDENILGEIKGSILINAILSKINEVFVGVTKNSDGSNTYSIEGPNGETCKFNLIGSNINFLPGSWEKIDPNLKQDIQKLFLERVQLILKK
ncbi:MAG: hypothetical protein HWN67_02095 [Candidatus Helarchaeota archaeon]|nr:hypothetical protein [Candidatus Helarchaeota archaeon]